MTWYVHHWENKLNPPPFTPQIYLVSRHLRTWNWNNLSFWLEFWLLCVYQPFQSWLATCSSVLPGAREGTAGAWAMYLDPFTVFPLKGLEASHYPLLAFMGQVLHRKSTSPEIYSFGRIPPSFLPTLKPSITFFRFALDNHCGRPQPSKSPLGLSRTWISSEQELQAYTRPKRLQHWVHVPEARPPESLLTKKKGVEWDHHHSEFSKVLLSWIVQLRIQKHINMPGVGKAFLFPSFRSN